MLKRHKNELANDILSFEKATQKNLKRPFLCAVNLNLPKRQQ